MTTTRILVLGDPEAADLEPLKCLEGSATIVAGNAAGGWRAAAAEAEVVVAWHSRLEQLQQVWPHAPRLRWIHTLSAGLQNVLFPQLRESSVMLTNARGIYSASLGEFALAAILFFAKDLRRMLRNQAAGVWERMTVADVAGQVAGIVGYGDVGRAVAHRAKALGMTVLGLCRRPRRCEHDSSADEVMGEQQLPELMSRSDYVVVSTPLTEATRGMLGRSELEAMKQSAVLINIGRGPVIDEPALIELLQLGRIRGAALDVFETEPLPAGHPFYRMENVLLSPHSADHAPGDTERSVRLFLDNFERYRKGEPLLNLVDKRQGY